ncbi:MAG: hypothetical protein WCR58_11835 [Bacteroidales bacterium]|jgi:hypothetical protein|nr:hypothetical protein [Bacteroidales bacterium]MDY0370343.1 hypothetical protein [Bacteroidales bacterium]
MNTFSRKLKLPLVILTFINVLMIFALYFISYQFLNLALVILSILLFLLIDLAPKNEVDKQARSTASKYILKTILATLISFSIVSIIKKDILLNGTAIIYISLLFIVLYHIFYQTLKLNITDKVKSKKNVKLKYLYWFTSILVIAFMAFKLIYNIKAQ